MAFTLALARGRKSHARISCILNKSLEAAMLHLMHLHGFLLMDNISSVQESAGSQVSNMAAFTNALKAFVTLWPLPETQNTKPCFRFNK